MYDNIIYSTNTLRKLYFYILFINSWEAGNDCNKCPTICCIQFSLSLRRFPTLLHWKVSACHLNKVLLATVVVAGIKLYKLLWEQCTVRQNKDTISTQHMHACARLTEVWKAPGIHVHFSQPICGWVTVMMLKQNTCENWAFPLLHMISAFLAVIQ